MIEVEMPNGSILEFPPDTPPDVMRQASQKYYSSISNQPAQKETAAPKPTKAVKKPEAPGKPGFWEGYGKKVVDDLTGVVGGIKNAVSFGFDDEINAAVGAPITALLEGKSLPESYRKNRDLSRKMDNYAQENAPGAYLSGQVTGAMINPYGGARTLGGRFLQSGGEALAYTIGNSKRENVGDQLAEGTKGALTSMAFTAGLEALGAGGKGINALYRHFTGKNADDLSRAQKFVFSKLQEQGKTPEEITAILEEAGQGAVPRTVAEISDSNPLLAAQKRFTQNPEPAGDVVRSFNTERFQQTIPGTVQKNIENISATTSPDLAGVASQKTAKNIIQDAEDIKSQIAAPLYEGAYQANQNIVSKDIDRILKTPAGKRALADAATKMQNDMTLLGVKDPELLKQAQLAGGKLAKGAKGGVAGGLKLQTLDYVKRALDDQIGVAQRAGANDEVRILMGLKDKLKKAMYAADVTANAGPNSLKPEGGLYQQALEKTSKEFAKINKIDDSIVGIIADTDPQNLPKVVGKVFSQTPRQIVKTKALFKKENPKVWDQLVASNLAQKFDESRNIEGFIRKLDETPGLQKQLAASFSNTQQRRDFELLIKHMREATKIKMGSDTVSNLAAEKMLDNELGSKLAKELSKDTPIRQRIAEFLGNKFQNLNDLIKMGNSEEVAQILTGKESRQLAKKLAGQKPGSPKALEEIAKFLSVRGAPIAAQKITSEGRDDRHQQSRN